MLKLGTPNSGYLAERVAVMLTGVHSLGEGHTVFFPHRTLERLVKGIGFEVIKHKTYPSKARQKHFYSRISGVFDNMQELIVRKPLDSLQSGQRTRSSAAHDARVFRPPSV